MSSTSNGMPINKEKAQILMNFRDNIIKRIKPFLQVLFTLRNDNDAQNHLTKDENVFVFDKDLIQNLITPGGGISGATHFLVILGAHNVDDNTIKVQKGDRTVMIVGCTQDATGKFRSIKLAEPAVEHPPSLAQVNFPENKLVGDEGAIEITLL